MSTFADTALDAGTVIAFLTILRAIIDLVKTFMDNRLQLREKEEEIRAKEAVITRLKSQVKVISEKYHKLKEAKNAVTL